MCLRGEALEMEEDQFGKYVFFIWGTFCILSAYRLHRSTTCQASILAEPLQLHTSH